MTNSGATGATERGALYGATWSCLQAQVSGNTEIQERFLHDDDAATALDGIKRNHSMVPQQENVSETLKSGESILWPRAGWS